MIRRLMSRRRAIHRAPLPNRRPRKKARKAVTQHLMPPPATTFRDYERAEFVRTVNDDTATFGLDVDQTSYYPARNWAQQRYVIHPDLVRAEEWINSFDYGYAAPAGDRFFAVISDMVAHPLAADRRIVRIGIRAPELEDGKPLNVTLVLNASGSMGSGNRVEIACAAAESIRGGLRSSDRIAVVQFSGEAIEDLVVEPTRATHAAARSGAVELLGQVELRWLTPADGEARSQQAAIVGGAATAASVRGQLDDLREPAAAGA